MWENILTWLVDIILVILTYLNSSSSCTKNWYSFLSGWNISYYPHCVWYVLLLLTSSDFYKTTGPYYACVSDHSNKEVRSVLIPSKIADFKDLKFIPKDDNPTGASNVYGMSLWVQLLTAGVCCTCCNFMTSAFCNNLMGFDVPTRLIFYYQTYDIDKWNMEPESNCTICNDMKKW